MDKPNLAHDNNDRLFPTKTSFVIFLSYISLFVNQGLLYTAIKRSQIPGFNAIVVVLLTELVKLLMCISLHITRSHGNPSSLFKDIQKNQKLLLLYLVPSFLYCLYNNLTFINLELFDLTTYYCLMQFRTVLTAVIYQILFRRRLTATQWLSLVILTMGCFLKEYSLYANMSKHQSQADTTSNSSIPTQTEKHDDGVNPTIKFIWLSVLLLLQMFCSCFAGVYNEFLLKDSSTAKNADVILQNIFMYLDSIFCNFIVYNLASNHDRNKEQPVDNIGVVTILHNLLTSPLALTLIINNAMSGLVASFFLKSLNSILKTFASALELFAIAFLAWVLFDDHIDLYTMIALFLVSAAMIVYSKNPVSVAPPGRSNQEKDGFMLIPTTEE